MSLEVPTWPKITGALGSTTTEFGASDWANLISDYYNGTNLALIDVSKLPIIGTLTRYVYEKFALYDIDGTHTLVFSVDDIDTGANRKIKFRRMNSPFEEDYAVLEGLAQAIINKTIDADLNFISNIKNADIKAAAAIAYSKLNLTGNVVNTDINASAAIAWTKLNKTGSILDDIEDVVITTAAQYNILIRNGSSQWINLAKGSNSTALTVDASGVLAYTTITNAMLAGSIAYSKLTLTGSIINTDVSASAAIAYSKLALTGSIVNADINASAAIAKTKLASLDVVNADVNASAAIATTKLADSANFLLKTLDNSFGAHYQDFTKMTAPGNPGANDIRLYVDTTDTHLKIRNNAGTVVDLHTGGGGGATNLDALTDVDLTTVAPVNGDVLTYTTTGTKWVPSAPPGAGGSVTASSVTTFTNKTIDADGTGNVITNIENADIKAAAAIVTTKLADSTNFVLTTRTNTFGAFDQILKSSRLLIRNPADTFSYTIAGGTISGATTLTLPTVTGTLQTENSTATVTNKTIDADGTGNSITNIENADIKAAAGIVYSKLNLATSILNADISASAAIATSKLADSANFILKTLDNSFGAHFFDITRMTAPANPAANDGRFYTKQIDTNNDGFFIKIKKNGSFQEVQIV